MSGRNGLVPVLPDGTEVLGPFVDAGLLQAAEVHVAATIARFVPDTAEATLLAAALTVRAARLGHVCLVVADVPRLTGLSGDDDPRDNDDPHQPPASPVVLPWPDPHRWAAELTASAAVTVRDPDSGKARGPAEPGVLRPLVFDGSRVYLERYWRAERTVGDALLARADHDVHAPSAESAVDAALDRFFGPGPGHTGTAEDTDTPPDTGGPGGTGRSGSDLQRRGARVALTARVAVLAGGPGTGKTHTVARLLGAALHLGHTAGRPLQVALAAPTGKAAARMTEAVHLAVTGADMPSELADALRATEASTLHRLLGSRGGTDFVYGPEHRLPHDLVVVDETSMVDLPLMARLFDALRPDARIVLVGDPNQLVSVEAGAVLGDVAGPVARGQRAAGPLADNVVVLERVHRFAADSAIATLADAVRTGDADGALEVLADPHHLDVTRVDPADRTAMAAVRAQVVDNAAEVVAAALTGDAVAGLERSTRCKVLCATRFGPLGRDAWRDRVEQHLVTAVAGFTMSARWYVGRPVIVTRNDYLTGVSNGDTGLVVRQDGQPVVALAHRDGLRTLSPSQLDATQTWWSMTIHKSQGSEFDHAVVSLPDRDSPVLTRELLYTAITRGRSRVTVVATEQTIRAAVDRPVARASGLGARLWSAAPA